MLAGRVSVFRRAQPADDRGVSADSLIDPRRLREFHDDFGAVAAEVLEVFERSAEETLADIRGALAQGDGAEARRLAHRLRGGARNVGATRVEELSARLEDAGPGAATDVAALGAALAPTFASLRAVLAA
jgi:chemotaxis protein histidine kinase CheA